MGTFHQYCLGLAGIALVGLATAAEPVPPAGRVVEGLVYSYVKDGVRHYSSKQPADGAESVREIAYKFREGEKSLKWWPLYDDKNISVDVDKTTAKRTGGVVRAWTRSTYATPQKVGQVQGTKIEKRFEEFDCNNRTTSITDVVYYSDAGVVLKSAAGFRTPAVNVVPDTVGEAVWDSVCQSKIW